MVMSATESNEKSRGKEWMDMGYDLLVFMFTPSTSDKH